MSKQFYIFSLAITIITLCFGLIASWWIGSLLCVIGCLICLLMGLISKYYALRIEFDKKLFDYLATNVDQLPNKLMELDEALQQLNLINTNQFPTRSIIERQKGTIKLLKKQIFWFILQILLLVGILISGMIRFG
ncbi:hypothetical protein GQ597_08375 [Gilliamella sp. Pra-s65]|uniref:hypothetical protein n=1 Tax=unclassified Gilliamella TaxID=2685620 RepID=UPI001322FA80|nr:MULTISPECIES: hypothetical protein [unclassified Gilliamella]MWN30895.1 hypothetical protein [Gilliamella sp. Pra-s60]MWN90715.1 hypothetical protein [Gilliamella sp. Pra-s65]MWP28540.1 hypothetical protein [Gilliamella sp. Pra-s54]MWP46970.1 hypothetical protein [Gilliamella sp. Pas-s27]MWP73654.1 hypothetical protein [Gilliamella sp. Pra-s52]